jgi:protein-S-isoprenylcysteine O-methyltransferase Ste14
VTPNRVAALVAIAASVVTGVIVPVLDVVHDPMAQAIIIVACILAAAAVAITWLIGWQKFEARRSPRAAERR